jgi:hypothetical protein
MWDFWNSDNMELESFLPSFEQEPRAQGIVQPYSDSPLDNEPVGENVYLGIINRAQKYVYIATPYLIIGSEYKTIPIAVQYLRGGYGSVDMGALMAVLTLSVIPVVIFYFFGQKFIIEGVAAGAVKG